MRNGHQFSVFSFRRGFLLLAIIALALSLVSLLRLAPQTQAQNRQNGATAPAPDGAPGPGPVVYPETKRGDTIDDYFGTKVADPYRWLENDAAPEVAAWV